MFVFLEMNVPSPVHDEENNGEQTFIDESDIINEYEVDDEGTVVQLCYYYLFLLEFLYTSLLVCKLRCQNLYSIEYIWLETCWLKLYILRI